MKRHAIWLITALFLAALASASPAAAAQCDKSWVNPVSGDWNDPFNWNPSTVPNAGTNVCITVAGTYSVTVSDSGAQAKGLTLGGSRGTQTLQIGGVSSHAKLSLNTQGSDGTAGILPNGLLALDNGTSGFVSTLEIANGTLTNAGTIESRPGIGSTDRTLTGNLDNQGTMTINKTLTDNSAAADVWTSSGTITIANDTGLFLTGTGKSFTQTGGTIANVTAACPGGQNGVATCGFHQVDGSFTATGGTATGNPLDLLNVTVNPSGTGSGVFNIRSTSNVLGSNVGSGYTLRLSGYLNGVHSKLNVNASRTNNGTIEMVDDGSGGNSHWVNVTSGTLTNVGTIHTLVGTGNTGGGRVLTGNLDNQGTLTVDASLTNNSGAADVWTTSGTITTASGQELSLSGAAKSFTQTAGTITNNGTFNVTGGLVAQTGGAATAGNRIQVVGGTLSPSGGSGNFDVSGSSTLGSNIGANHNVGILGGLASSHAQLTVVNKTNNGTLTLNGLSPSFATTLDATGGTLTNAGTIQVVTGAGGSRAINGSLDNQGTLTVDESVTGGGGASVWTSSGTLTVASLKTLALSFTSGSFTQTAGAITNNGTFTVTGGTFAQTGGAATAGNRTQVVSATFSPSGGSGNFDVGGTSTLGSNIGASHIVAILGGLASAHAQLNVVDKTNSGTLTLNSIHSSFATTLNATGGTLTNPGTIQVVTGAGGSRDINGTISSSGTIDIDESVPMASGSWANTGNIDVASGKTLTIAFGATVSQSSPGSITGSGTIQVNGTLSGVGSVGPVVINNGIVSPGASPGILSLGSTYTQTGSGELRIEISGANPGTQHDQLAISGAASLAGKLLVTSPGFTPTNGQTFQILTYASLTGTFGTVQAPGYDIQYGPTGVVSEGNGNPTAVRALAFTARRDHSASLLRWRMGSELGLAGYAVYRNGARISRVLIPAGRGSYSFRDRRPGAHPRYVLYAVGLDGRRMRLASAAA